MRLRVLAILPLAAAFASCGAQASAPPALPAGVRSADGTELYSARADAQARRTTVSAVDPVTRRTRT